jgi:hypothetical protein
MRRFIQIVSLLAVLAGAYVGWATYGVYDLGRALHSRNAERALQLMDVRSVRRSVIAQVLEKTAERIEGAGRYGDIARNLAISAATAAIDRRAEALLTDDVLRRLLVEGRLPDGFGETGEPDAGGAPVQEAPSEGGGEGSGTGSFSIPRDPLRHLMDVDVLSIGSFRIVIGDEDDRPGWTGLVIERDGLVWKLVGVELSDAVMARIAPILEEKLKAVL